MIVVTISGDTGAIRLRHVKADPRDTVLRARYLLIVRTDAEIIFLVN